MSGVLEKGLPKVAELFSGMEQGDTPLPWESYVPAGRGRIQVSVQEVPLTETAMLLVRRESRGWRVVLWLSAALNLKTLPGEVAAWARQQVSSLEDGNLAIPSHGKAGIKAIKRLPQLPGRKIIPELAAALAEYEVHGESTLPWPKEIRDEIAEALGDLAERVNPRPWMETAAREVPTEDPRTAVHILVLNNEDDRDALLMGMRNKKTGQYRVILGIRPGLTVIPREIAAWARETVSASSGHVIVEAFNLPQ